MEIALKNNFLVRETDLINLINFWKKNWNLYENILFLRIYLRYF